MEKIETFFSMQSACDSKHIRNTSERPVSQELLDAVEAGCSLETVERLMRDFDVYKYSTQITIHGLFPDVSKNRIGQYVNLVQNKNRSIGVRYSGIDAEKKARLSDLIRAAKTDWKCRLTSTSFSIFRIKSCQPIDGAKNEPNAVAKEMNEHMQSVSKDLFFGSASVYGATYFGGFLIAEEFNINAFYERNMKALFESITGVDYDATVYAVEQQRLEWERECTEYQKRAEHHKQLKLAAKDAFIAQGLPDGVVHIEQYKPKRGDQVMLFHYDYHEDTDSYSVTPTFWEVYWIGATQFRLRKDCDKKVALIGKPRYVRAKVQTVKAKTPMPNKSTDAKVKIIVYSEKAIAVVGDTKAIKSKLMQLGGRFNPRLSCGAGWIFSKKKQQQLETALGL